MSVRLAPSSKNDVIPSKHVNFKGSITHVLLEGGFWGIISYDGEHYDPRNLGQEFQQHGLHVQVEGVIRDDIVSFHMWGTIIDIIKISVINPTK